MWRRKAVSTRYLPPRWCGRGESATSRETISSYNVCTFCCTNNCINCIFYCHFITVKTKSWYTVASQVIKMVRNYTLYKNRNSATFFWNDKRVFTLAPQYLCVLRYLCRSLRSCVVDSTFNNTLNTGNKILRNDFQIKFQDLGYSLSKV